MTPGTEIANGLFEREEWQREGLVDGAWLADEIDRKIEEERAACLDIAEAWTSLTGPENEISAMTARKIARKIRARSQLPLPIVD